MEPYEKYILAYQFFSYIILVTLNEVRNDPDLSTAGHALINLAYCYLLVHSSVLFLKNGTKHNYFILHRVHCRSILE